MQALFSLHLQGLPNQTCSLGNFLQAFWIFMSSTIKVYWIIEVFELLITALYIISPYIIQVSKDTLTIPRTSRRIVDLAFWYQRLSRLPYIFLHLTPYSGKYVRTNQWKVLVSQLYLNTDAAGIPKTSVTIHQITCYHVRGDRNICSKTT